MNPKLGVNFASRKGLKTSDTNHSHCSQPLTVGSWVKLGQGRAADLHNSTWPVVTTEFHCKHDLHCGKSLIESHRNN